MEKKPIQINWEGLKKHVNQCAKNGYEYIYRGQSSTDWTLTSTWHRLPSDVPNRDLNYFWNLVYQLYDDIGIWTGYQWNLDNPVDKGAFLSFLQHHGFPTPLLDWTKSPYIAAYFAFEGVKDESPDTDNISIFVFDHLTFADDWKQVFDLNPTDPFVSVLRASPKGNLNQIAQQGVYTYSSVVDQRQHMIILEDRRNTELKENKTYFIQYLLPVSEKPMVMRELRMMGITAMSLFPGVDGICKTYKQEHYACSKIGRSREAFVRELMAEAQAKNNEKDKEGSFFKPAKKSFIRKDLALSTPSNK